MTLNELIICVPTFLGGGVGYAYGLHQAIERRYNEQDAYEHKEACAVAGALTGFCVGVLLYFGAAAEETTSDARVPPPPPVFSQALAVNPCCRTLG